MKRNQAYERQQCNRGSRDEDGKKRHKNIQQLKFACGHPPYYYAVDLWLKYGRADGMPCSPQSMAVCANSRIFVANIAYDM